MFKEVEKNLRRGKKNAQTLVNTGTFQCNVSSAFPPPESPPMKKIEIKGECEMKIEINNGVYTRDNEVAALLTGSEDEYMAALAQKLVVRKERELMKQEKAKEQERLKRERMNHLLNGDAF